MTHIQRLNKSGLWKEKIDTHAARALLTLPAPRAKAILLVLAKKATAIKNISSVIQTVVKKDQKTGSGSKRARDVAPAEEDDVEVEEDAEAEEDVEVEDDVEVEEPRRKVAKTDDDEIEVEAEADEGLIEDGVEIDVGDEEIDEENADEEVEGE